MAKEDRDLWDEGEFDEVDAWESEFLYSEPEDEQFTLESILAEYKGTAYIDGDRRTPRSVLQERTNQIVKEVTGRAEQKPLRETEKASLPKTQTKTGTLPKVIVTAPPPVVAEPAQPTGPVARQTTGKIIPVSAKTNQDVITFDQLQPTAKTAKSTYKYDVEKAIEKQTQMEDETIQSVGKAIGLFHRNSLAVEEDIGEEFENLSDEREPVAEEEVFEEPDFRAAVKKFADGCNTYSMRSFVSLVLSVVMAILTLVFQAGPNLPFIGNNKIAFTGILLIFLFIVMMLSIDKLIQGIVGLFRRGLGLESLNLMSCLMTAAAAMYSIISKDTSAGMPYCVISAFSLTFTLWGEKIYYKALTETMKTAVSVSGPSGVIAEINADLGKTVIKKASGRTASFYNNLVQADIGEIAYRFAAPILIVAAIALGFYASLGPGLAQNVLRNVAAVMAAAAPFSAMMTFAVSFSAVAKRARRSGAAIAGWGGADDIFHSDGASITDEDLFPMGTVSLGGIKIFEEVSPEKALRYTASLIIASNCGLTKLFSEHLSKQGMNLIRVEDFSCYEGGIGGMIRGERVIAGSAAFMNLMGIRIPTSLNVKNAIFTAVNKKLIAVFAINYVPTKSVQNALFSILRYRVKLFFAMRDFNVTPVMLEQKYKVPVDAVEYIPIQESYEISDANKHEAKRVSAILTREGLGPFVEAITGGRRLRSTALINTIFSLATAGLGMLLMFIIAWTGTTPSAVNLLLYMLAMFFAVLLVSGFARFRQ